MIRNGHSRLTKIEEDLCLRSFELLQVEAQRHGLDAHELLRELVTVLQMDPETMRRELCRHLGLEAVPPPPDEPEPRDEDLAALEALIRDAQATLGRAP